MYKPQKRASIIAILLLSVLAASLVAYGIVLYTLSIPSNWGVRVAYGLQLTYANSTPVTAISWLVDPLGSQTQSFIVKNTGNHDGANVTMTMPLNTAQYQFTTTFANTTISMGGSYAFNVTLVDLGMDSSTTYAGNFAWSIVDSFPPSNDTFGASQISYASDSASYFQFQTESFNQSSYTPGSTVLYSFVTKNLNQTYQITALTYGLGLYDSNNALVATIADGLTVAYWQNSTNFGAFGNGTWMVNQPLSPNGTITIWNSFPAPTPGGIYHLQLSYQGHNASPAPPPQYPITWTKTTTNNRPDYISITAFTITNATKVGENGTVTFTLTAINSGSGDTYCHFVLSVPELSLTIKNSGGPSSVTLIYTSPHVYTYPLNITSGTGGALTMQLAVTFDGGQY